MKIYDKIKSAGNGVIFEKPFSINPYHIESFEPVDGENNLCEIITTSGTRHIIKGNFYELTANLSRKDSTYGKSNNT